jgi:DNA-binding NarL/FixJ family response regulator
MQAVPCPPRSIVVAHGEPLIAAGIAHWLAQGDGWRVSVAPDARAHEAADIVVTDYHGGLRGAARARLLVVTGEQREHEVRRALEAGVHGYLLDDCEHDELLRCVRALAAGARYFSLAAAQAMASSLGREALTGRENDVLALLAQGHCNKRIAGELGIALGTVKSHVKALMAKLDAHSRTEVVAVAAARGLARLQPPAAQALSA